MRKKVKGAEGASAQYVTRNKALHKLQISLKDFRRLCILKGIFPRDPKKKKFGRDKTYYHVKDIAFLQHEPLLNKFRGLKTFIKKYKKALTKNDLTLAKQLKDNKPQLQLDHLVKERYSSFVDALRDLDDPLCTVFLFSTLPAIETSKGFSPERSAMCKRLTREWQSYVFFTKTLRKVFVSIKGMYYQADVQGQPITWLVPHQFSPVLPRTVDYSVMLTFLHFYETLLKFVNFKLYHDVGLAYPPALDQAKDHARSGLQLLNLVAPQGGPVIPGKPAPLPGKAGAAAARLAAAGLVSAEKLQKQVDGIISKMNRERSDAAKERKAAKKGGAVAAAAADADEAMRDAETQEPTEDPEEQALLDTIMDEDGPSGAALENLTDSQRQALEARKAARSQESDAVKIRKLFKGLLFVLGREVPQDSLEFVILCANGAVIRQDVGTTAEELANPAITHFVTDRPPHPSKPQVAGRNYVQPQWVYDSFNARALLPIAPYQPGVSPPPHLSPFVDDYKEGYVPQQRLLLEQWGAEATTGTKKTAAEIAESKRRAKKVEDEGSDREADEVMTAESEFQKELGLERSGVSFSQRKQAEAAKASASAAAGSKQQQQDEDEDDEEEGDDEGEVDDDDEGDDEEGVVQDSDSDEEGEPQAAAAPAPAKLGTASLPGDRNLASIMMSKKNARLYNRMQHGIEEKRAANENLMKKRKQLEETSAPASPAPQQQQQKGGKKAKASQGKQTAPAAAAEAAPKQNAAGSKKGQSKPSKKSKQ